MIALNRIFNQDCLEGMKQLESGSVDLIVSDPPYGVTKNEWDKPVDLSLLWEQYKRVIKLNGAIILHSQFPYSIDLIISNRGWFRYDLIWDKGLVTGFLNARRQPLRIHEHILVFYQKAPIYNPVGTVGHKNHRRGGQKEEKNRNYGDFTRKESNLGRVKMPTSLISINKPHPSQCKHATQKSVELEKYLIELYSNPGDLVLDSFMGVGTTGIAAILSGRRFVGYDINPEYFAIAAEEIQKASAEQDERPRQKGLFDFCEVTARKAGRKQQYGG